MYKKGQIFGLVQDSFPGLTSFSGSSFRIEIHETYLETTLEIKNAKTK